MADLHNKKTVEEDDPIKKMLEKLRQSVAAPVTEPTPDEDVAPSPAEKTAETKEKNGGRRKKAVQKAEVADNTAPVDIFETGLVTEILPQEETPASQTVELPFEETAFLPVEDAETPATETDAFAEESEEPDDVEELVALSDEEPDEEDKVDDAVIAQFFAAEENAPVTDEAPSEQSEAPAEPERVEEPLAIETPAAEAAVEELTVEEEEDAFVTEEMTEGDDGREYDVISFEDSSFLDDVEEEDGVTPTLAAEEFADILREREKETFAAFDTAATDEVDEPFELVVEEDEVSKSEADLLFRPAPAQNLFPQADEEEELPWETENEPQPPREEPPIIPNEDNGYAVEVEVRSDSAAWYMPPVSPKEESVAPIVEEIAEPAPVVKEETSVPPKPTDSEQIAPTVSTATRPNAPVVEDFFADDADDADEPAFIAYGDESVPLPKNEEGASQATLQETDEEEGRSYTSFTQPLTMPMPKLADGEKMPARKVLASFFGRKGGAGTGRKKVWREKKKSMTPDALSGIYNEAGADYHEYTSRNQITLFSERFVADITSCTVRVFILAFLCTLLLLLENLGRLGVTLGGFFAQPGGLATTHLILMVMVILCCVPMFTYAWRHLFANRVLPEAYLAISLLIAFLYDAYLLLAAEPAPFLFGLVPAVSALILSVVDRLKMKGDYTAFKLVSSSGDKLACTVSCGAQTAEEADAVSDLEEGKDTRVLFVKKVGFTSGFFHRVSRVCEDGRKNLWLLITALVGSMMAAIVVGVLQHSLSAGLYAFCVTASFAFPTCTLLLHKLPVAQLFACASANHSAVVGEVSALEYCDAAANAFEDVEAFPSRNVRVQRIKLYGDSALDRVLYQMAGVFSVVGGPLDGVFRSSTAEIGLPSHVRLLHTEGDGLAVMVDGREIRVGRGEYMLRQHIHVYYDPEDENILANGKTNVMYAAENGRLIAKFYIRYKMDADFEKDVEQLHKCGIRTILRTYDPNINEALIATISYTANFGIRVVKKTEEQQKDFAVARLNSGIVTKAATRNILRTLSACRRMCRLTSFLENGAMLIACVGMLLALFASVFGSIFAVPSFFFALYQLLFVGIVALVGKLYI